MNGYRITIRGIVQSVGFRPYMFRAFRGYSGWVKNSGKGVEMYLEGSLSESEIRETIFRYKPPNANIESIEITKSRIFRKAFYRFFIRNTAKEVSANNPTIPPDLGICDECARELFEKSNRRFLHPFINCTNCGPRFSIIKQMPYNRDRTTMENFEMCELCREEFESPYDRRFHAQPICCNNCGPTYFLIKNREVMSEGLEAIKMTIRFIKNGEVVLLKGVGGYHFVCDAINTSAVNKLKKMKYRDKKPFAVIIKNLEIAKRHCFVSNQEERLLKSQIKPILLLKKKELNFLEEITLASPYLGVMIPYAPIYLLLFHFSDIEFLVATSANLTEKPIIYSDGDAISFSSDLPVLSNNRKIVRPLEDSIVAVNNDTPLVFRLGRGFAPLYLNLKTKQNVLALGTDLKNNIAITLKDKVVFSQYVGNLEEFENYERFEKNVNDFMEFFSFKPDITVCDEHPLYLSSNFAQERFENVLKVQHHKAHFGSVLYENQMKADTIGVILDGTGYGDDGAIWGGEFFIKTKNTIERIGHLKYMPFAFGDKAIREPYRLAILWLYKILKDKAFGHPLFEENPRFKDVVKSLKTAKTSSAGRLFDVVSVLIGISKTSSYEAEAAINLTYAAMCSNTEERFCYKVENFEIDFSETIRELVETEKAKQDLARMFHNTFCDAIVQNTVEISRQTGIKAVAISGGVFQNEIVFKSVKEKLFKRGFEVFTNKKVPINDGGIALGQIYLESMK